MTRLMILVQLWYFVYVYADDAPKIAIIGGGIGGASCSYFLRELFQSNVDIDLFEQSPILGGRLATIRMAGHEYESGGSIIHKRNRYMGQFVEKFDLKKRLLGSSSSAPIGIFNGHEFVFRESWWTVVDMVKALWRYGFDFIRLRKTLESTLDVFDRIYDHQEKGITFNTVNELLRSMNPDILDTAGMTLEKYLTKQGFSRRFINEVAGAAVRTNYGQNTSVGGFVGSVALAGSQKGLWAVKSGNRMVAKSLVDHSNASLHHCRIDRISKLSIADQQSYSLTCATENGFHDFIGYDAVVLAVPLIKGHNEIEFDGFQLPVDNYGSYHRVYATFVHGGMKENALRLCEDWSLFSSCPVQVLVCCDDNVWFNSIGLLRPIDPEANCTVGKKGVWKIFSRGKLNESDLGKLFDEVVEWKTVEWLAYPEYTDPEIILQHIQRAKFEVVDGLYHINPIEWAASAMEMSVIGARNVALLLHHKIKGVSSSPAHDDVQKENIEQVPKMEL